MSTYSIKGFVSIPSLHLKTPDAVSPIGEATNYSLTYTKDRVDYQNTITSGYMLFVMSSKDSITGDAEINTGIADQILEISKWTLDFLRAKVLPIDKTSLVTSINAQFFEQIQDLQIGDIVDSGLERMPQWMSWKKIGSDNNIRIWYSDSAFRQQYTEYSITVIPPLDNIDDIFLAPSVVSQRLSSRTPSETTSLIQAAKNGKPETIIRTETYDYVSPTDSTNKIPTNWSVLIYGSAGDNIDSIKQAIIDYIVANSTHTVSEWTARIPDIFKKTEFIIYPRWDKFAINGSTLQHGIYSAISDVFETLSFAKQKINNWTDLQVESSCSVLVHPWNSISVVFVGSPDNKDDSKKIEQVFPDYICVGTSSLDFNRMFQKTQAFSLNLEQMLITAETATQYTSVPSNQRRVVRDNKVYISMIMDNIQYLVYSKMND